MSAEPDNLQIDVFTSGGEPLWTADEVSAEAGLAPRSFHAYVQRGMAPEPMGYVSRTPLWADSDVSAWLDTRKPRTKK